MNNLSIPPSTSACPPDAGKRATGDAASAQWHIAPPYGLRTLIIILVAFAILWHTGHRVEMDRMASLTAEGVAAAVGLRESSQISNGAAKLMDTVFPIQIADRIEIARIENFDRNALPWLSYVETIEHAEQRLNPDTMAMEQTIESKEYLVHPVGYLSHVLIKMVETLEIALWGTLLAILLSLPLAFFGARNYTSNRLAYFSARSLVSLFRAIPELVSALFLVLLYGFGPIAGITALAIHGAGFLGKFYGEDIENADDKPQEALRAIGANKIKVLCFAVLPQVWPQYIAYTMYILDRNVRMATVIGLVGAGGIGQELKGRYDMYNYAHVGTILLVIFITVFILDQLAARMRSRYL